MAGKRCNGTCKSPLCAFFFIILTLTHCWGSKWPAISCTHINTPNSSTPLPVFVLPIYPAAPNICRSLSHDIFGLVNHATSSTMVYIFDERVGLTIPCPIWPTTSQRWPNSQHGYDVFTYSSTTQWAPTKISMPWHGRQRWLSKKSLISSVFHSRLRGIQHFRSTSCFPE